MTFVTQLQILPLYAITPWIVPLDTGIVFMPLYKLNEWFVSYSLMVSK